ncbi:hypothetical protein K474DRAFT_1684974 [Panus rudis PR-1116 ss-1]|nr:hypothetical protein K474DRAFT_1684974 [Panus rudis PR-1116 ss-1]
MKSFFAVAAALASVVPALAQSTAMVNTVTGITQCQPIQFTWSGGQGPYFLSLIPAGQPSAAPIKDFGQQSGTSFTWSKVDLPAGSTFTIALKDQTGQTVYSDTETVNSGPDSSCLTASASVTETGSSGGSATSASSATSPPASATTGAGSSPSSAGSSKPASSGASGSKTSSGSAASQTANNNGAGSVTVSTFGIAGLMGLVGAALF